MTSPSLRSRLARLVRGRPAPPADVLDPYAAAVLSLADRAEAMYHEWIEHTTLVADSEKLANAAAIHRWEAARMARRLEGVTPPADLVHDHGRLVEAIQLASRASQLLSSGSRYHNANALCEGQMLLTESRTRRLKALALLRRFVHERATAPTETASRDAPAAADGVSAATARPELVPVETTPGPGDGAAGTLTPDTPSTTEYASRPGAEIVGADVPPPPATSPGAPVKPAGTVTDQDR